MENREYSILEMPVFIKNKNNKDKSNEFIKNENIQFLKTTERLFEFDEKIFYGLLSLASEHKNNGFSTDYVELLKYSGITYNGGTLGKVKNSLKKLNEIEMIFKNIKIKDGINILKIIEKYSEVLIEKNQEIEVRNKNIHYILKIKIDRIIFREIDGFDFSMLMLVKSTLSKRLIILIKYYIKNEQTLSIEKKMIDLCEIMPLNSSKENLTMSYKYLMKAFDEIKNTGYLENVELIKEEGILNYKVRFKISQQSIEKDLLELLKKIKIEKKINLPNHVRKKEDDELTNEIKKIAIELKGLIAETEKILTECDIENRYIIKDILISIIEKIHNIKGIAKFICEFKIFDIAFEEEKKLTEYVKSKVEIKTGILKEVLSIAEYVLKEV